MLYGDGDATRGEDLFNVTNQGVASGVQEVSGQAFGQPTQWTPARTAQIAGRFKF